MFVNITVRLFEIFDLKFAGLRRDIARYFFNAPLNFSLKALSESESNGFFRIRCRCYGTKILGTEVDKRKFLKIPLPNISVFDTRQGAKVFQAFEVVETPSDSWM